MAIILRFANKKGLVKEHSFDLVHVCDTTIATIKNEMCDVLSRHNLKFQNLRGEGYDGTSNMWEEWNDL